MLSIIISILIFGLVIFVHEFGHFITAKLSGIKVNEFSIGMGPKIIGFNKNETEYSVRRLPIGGYVAMEGEDEDSEAEGSFSRAPAPTRFVVLVAGAVNNFILGFLVLCLLVNMDTAI
ncbi:MAG: site-2 protease family protein, partial [Oscillospiraceae bacterium]|nr:site-2 protease family protein [Oscillospiraceae bacterium]